MIQIKEVIAESGNEHLGINCDVSNTNNVKNAINKTLKCFGRIDAIIIMQVLHQLQNCTRNIQRRAGTIDACKC